MNDVKHECHIDSQILHADRVGQASLGAAVVSAACDSSAASPHQLDSGLGVQPSSLTTTFTFIEGRREVCPEKLPETGGASAGCRVTAVAM